MSAFRADATQLADDATLLTLHGAIGALDVDDLRELTAAVQTPRLVIDTTPARVEDSGVLEVLLDLAREARQTGLLAVVAPLDGELDRVLATTGLERAFSLYPDLRSALDDLDLPSPDLR